MTTPERSVEEIVEKMTQHTVWRDNAGKVLENRLRELLEAKRQRCEEMVEEVMEVFYCMNFDLTLLEQHQFDHEIKALAQKYGITQPNNPK